MGEEHRAAARLDLGPTMEPTREDDGTHVISLSNLTVTARGAALDSEAAACPSQLTASLAHDNFTLIRHPKVQLYEEPLNYGRLRPEYGAIRGPFTLSEGRLRLKHSASLPAPVVVNGLDRSVSLRAHPNSSHPHGQPRLLQSRLYITSHLLRASTLYWRWIRAQGAHWQMPQYVTTSASPLMFTASTHLLPIAMPAAPVQAPLPDAQPSQIIPRETQRQLSAELRRDSLEGIPATSLLEYLTTPNPSPTLVERAVSRGRVPQSHIWSDICNLRSWTDSGVATMAGTPGLLRLLQFPISVQPLAAPGRVCQNLRTHARLHNCVKYLRGLARLHRFKREQRCEHGFIITEIELPRVRNGVPSSNIPLSGYLGITTSVQMATHGPRSGSPIPGADFSDGPGVSLSDIQMTATLAPFYPHVLAKEWALSGQYEWRLGVGRPAAPTGQYHLEKDGWIPKANVSDKRAMKSIGGWVFSDEPLPRGRIDLSCQIQNLLSRDINAGG
ncbi:hypothetical protein LTR28_011569 [Elasticomyces elasticus]|nr:hypothetical protein LTR28_011569 [Elasticomyces elasticus]